MKNDHGLKTYFQVAHWKNIRCWVIKILAYDALTNKAL